MQLAWKMGSTLVSKITVLSGLEGGDWAKSKGDLRTSIRPAAQQREVEKRVIPANIMISLFLS